MASSRKGAAVFVIFGHRPQGVNRRHHDAAHTGWASIWAAPRSRSWRSTPTAASACAARADAAGRLRRDARCDRRTSCARRSARSALPRARAASASARRDRCRAATGLPAQLELGVPQRPSRSSADLEALLGARGPHEQRRQLLRAVGGAATAPAPGARVVFGVILGTGVGAGIVVDGKVARRAQRDRRRVGPQSACRGRATTSVPVRRATAAARVASRPGCRARRFERDHARARAATSPTARDRRAAPRAGDAPRDASLARYEDAPRARARARRSTSSIPT